MELWTAEVRIDCDWATPRYQPWQDMFTKDVNDQGDKVADFHNLIQ